MGRKKKKEISAEDARQIVLALYLRHEDYLKEGEEFDVSGFRSPDEVYTQVLLSNQDDSFHYPVECRVNPKLAGISSHDAQELLLDFQDYYFGRFFREGRDLFLPIDWGPIDFEDIEIQARGQILNLRLERMADRLIAGEEVDPNELSVNTAEAEFDA